MAPEFADARTWGTYHLFSTGQLSDLGFTAVELGTDCYEILRFSAINSIMCFSGHDLKCGLAVNKGQSPCV